MQKNLLQTPGMIPALATFAFCISGLSLLMPTSPAWVTSGGSGELGAGLVTAVLMVSTVATQILAVQRSLETWGWAKTLTAGSLLMGLPSALQAVAPNLPLVLLSSVFRGMGFGVLTVCCSTALTLLVPAIQRGRAIGYYGLAAAIPQLVFTPLAPWLIEHLGYRPVLTSGLIASLGVPFAWKLGRAVEEKQGELLPVNQAQENKKSKQGSFLIGIWPALLTLTLTTAAGGAFMTFISDMAASPTLASTALLAMMACATPGRLYGGTLTDALGTKSTMTPVLALNGIGLALLAGSLSLTGNISSLVLLLLGSVLTGIGYGFLQSVTMVRALTDAGEENTAAASVAWNSNFDLGTGLGGLIIGALASLSSFTRAWIIWALLMLICALTIGFIDSRKYRPNNMHNSVG